MKARLATDDGERRYAKRMATVEPVFSNLESSGGSDYAQGMVATFEVS